MDTEYYCNRVYFSDGSNIELVVWDEESVQSSVYFNSSEKNNDYTEHIESDTGLEDICVFEFKDNKYVLKIEI